jgi:hypothetical protein
VRGKRRSVLLLPPYGCHRAGESHLDASFSATTADDAVDLQLIDHIHSASTGRRKRSDSCLKHGFA